MNDKQVDKIMKICYYKVTNKINHYELRGIMKITLINGTLRKSTTYQIAKQFVDSLSSGDNVDEFFMPKDCPNFCRSCCQCFKDNTKCPDYNYVKPILDSMLSADLIIITSPVFVFHATGQLKAFLDHLAFSWMAHRPNKAMFNKQALIIATAAGAGTKSTIKDINDSTDYWGIARTYKLGQNVAAADWNGVSDENKAKISSKVNKLSKKILKQSHNVKPCIKVKGIFYLMRFVHKKFGINPPDVEYWKANGWLDKERPWKQ